MLQTASATSWTEVGVGFFVVCAISGIVEMVLILSAVFPNIVPLWKLSKFFNCWKTSSSSSGLDRAICLAISGGSCRIYLETRLAGSKI
jgi:hypothetical protein